MILSRTTFSVTDSGMTYHRLRKTLPDVCLSGLLFVLFFLPNLNQLRAAEVIDPYLEDRLQMVEEQLKTRGIDDPRVLSAMSTVPRHLFVNKTLKKLAYHDGPLPIGHGQTISQPFIVAYMSQVIGLQPGQRVLEIGTGSGYQAAILAELTDKVYTIEIVKPLAKKVDNLFEKLGYHLIQRRQGDGYYGLPEVAPFDAIVVTAAAEYIPPPLLKQLKDGGRMIIPVGSPFRVQHLLLVTKENGTVRTRKMMAVRFVPFRRVR